jgi:hypothetical protein
LVLSCEIADKDSAMEIASFCWSELESASASPLKMDDPQYLRAVHCLRFLREAFRTRISAIDSFRASLTVFIRSQLLSQRNLLSKKIAVEEVGLLGPDDIDETLILALDANNRWIDEITLKSCHYLPRLSVELTHKLRLRLDGVNISSLMKRRKELLFSLGLSEVFADLKAFCRWRVADTYCWSFALLLVLTLKPFMLVLIAPCIFVTDRLNRLLSSEQERFASFIERQLVWVLVLMVGISYFAGPSAHTGASFAGRFVVVGAFLLAIPWYQIRFHVPWILTHAKLEIEDVVFAILGVGISCPAFWLAVFILLNLPPETQRFLLLVTALGITIPGLHFGTRDLVALRRDFRVVDRLIPSLVASRHEIAEEFGKFRTARGRLKFVRFLDAIKTKPKGSWPDGWMPYVKDDEASTLLAQLEEHWLGLDR